MVDFNSDATVGSSPRNLLTILIIQRVNDFLEQYEKATQDYLEQRQPSISKVKARLQTLYLTTKQLLKRHLKEENLQEQINNAQDLKSLQAIYEQIDNTLDNAKITRVDTRQSYNQHNIEEENKAQDL